MQDARGSLPYAYPRLPRLELKVMGKKHYARTKDKRRLLAYERVPGRVRFFLDEAVYADTARALLPEIAGYGAGLIDHLFRARDPHRHHGRRARWCRSSGRAGNVRKGEIRVFAEDASGLRQPLATVQPGSARVAHQRVPAGTQDAGAPSCAAKTTPATSSPSAKPRSSSPSP